MVAPDRCVHAGFSLLEVLVALMVLAVGLLGLAGMQARSLTLARDAELALVMSAQAESLAESMRANGIASATASGGLAYSWAHYEEEDYTSHLTVPGQACQAGTECSAADLAAWDLYRFKQALAARFPASSTAWKAVVCRAAPGSQPSFADSGCRPSGELGVRIVWRQRQDARTRAALASGASATVEKRYVLPIQTD